MRVNGTDYYLGKYGSQESRDEYGRLLGEWMIKGCQAPLKELLSNVLDEAVNQSAT